MSINTIVSAANAYFQGVGRHLNVPPITCAIQHPEQDDAYFVCVQDCSRSARCVLELEHAGIDDQNLFNNVIIRMGHVWDLKFKS